MKKKSTKGRFKKREIRIDVGPEPTIADIERAIEGALANKPTDFFRNSKDVVVIITSEGGVIEQPGEARKPK